MSIIPTIRSLRSLVDNTIGDMNSSIEEYFDSVSLTFVTDNPKLINVSDVSIKFQEFPTDNIYIDFIVYDEIECICNLNNSKSIEIFNETLSKYIEDEDFTDYCFKIRINKTLHDGIIYVYDLHAFVAYLNKLDILSLLHLFYEYENNIFYVLDKTINLRTGSYVFTNELTNDLQDLDSNLRMETLDKSHYIINQNGGNTYQFIPNDFYLKERSEFDGLNKVFDKLCIFLSLLFISNYSELTKNQLICKLVGYKTVTLVVDLFFNDNIVENTVTSYFNIFNWIYEGKNVSDKCGIARNVLSLYVNNSNVWNIAEDIFSFVLSCEEIYLKENIDKYIEVKGNVFNLLNELNGKLVV